MNIEPFCTADIPLFLELAAAENWVAEEWEFEFLLTRFPQGCFTARGDDNNVAGFVTSLCHEQSGWIGNLIVANRYRGKGVGRALFSKALESLRQAGTRTIWLTASKSGMPLYEKYGFTSIDTVIRWVGSGRQRHMTCRARGGSDALMRSSCDLDTRAWGDHRSALLEATNYRGAMLQNESGFIICQPCGDSFQFGPFAAEDAGIAARLFEEAAGTIAIGSRFLLDTPASNRSALRLYNRRKMRIAGSNVLMYAGRKPEYRPELIYGLATMGSCG